MAQPSQPQSLTDKIKSAFGLPSQGAGPRPINTGASGAAGGLRRQDSFPGGGQPARPGPAAASNLWERARRKMELHGAAAATVLQPPPPACVLPMPSSLHPPPHPTHAWLLPTEICSTPSEVGLFEVAHNKALHGPDGKFSWRKVRRPAGRGPLGVGTGGGAGWRGRYRLEGNLGGYPSLR